MGENFNLFFNPKLDAQGGNPTIKKKSLAKFMELKESYELCDIWRVRNTKSRRLTFTLKHSSGFPLIIQLLLIIQLFLRTLFL